MSLILVIVNIRITFKRQVPQHTDREREYSSECHLTIILCVSLSRQRPKSKLRLCVYEHALSLTGYKHTTMSYLFPSSSVCFLKLLASVLNTKGNVMGPHRNVCHGCPNVSFFFQFLVFHLVLKLILGFQTIKKKSGINILSYLVFTVP